MDFVYNEFIASQYEPTLLELTLFTRFKVLVEKLINTFRLWLHIILLQTVEII